MKESVESERKYFSHRKSYKNNENKSILISEKPETNRARLTLRSNPKKQTNSLFSSKNSTSKKPR